MLRATLDLKIPMAQSICPIFDEASKFIGVWALNRNFQPSLGALGELMSLAQPTLKAFNGHPHRRVFNESVDVGNGVRFEGGVFVMIGSEEAPNEKRANSKTAYVLIDMQGIACLMRTNESDARLEKSTAAEVVEKELWSMVNEEWARVMRDNECIPRYHDEEWSEWYSWRRKSADGTPYDLTISSDRWDPLPDGRPAIKVELRLSGGKLLKQGRGGCDKVLSKDVVCPLQTPEGEDPIEAHYRNLARDLVDKYGTLQRVEFSRPPSGESFVFQRGTVHSSDHGIADAPVSLASMSHRYLKAFLDAAGFQMSREDAKGINAGALLQARDGGVVISYPYKEVSEPPVAWRAR